MDVSVPAGQRGTLKNGILLALVYLMVFQSPLEGISSIFKLIDELVALAGLCMLIWEAISYGRLRMKHYVLTIFACLLLFTLAGLAGNVLYQYQPWNLVLKDLFINLKFFFSLVTGYEVTKLFLTQSGIRQINVHLCVITVLLFALVCLEQVYPLFGEREIRYGMRSAQIFFLHSTYMAGALAFIITALTVFYRRQNLPFIGLALVMLMLTLRSKALASAAVYVLLFVFIILLQGKLKLWHLCALGVGAVIVGWGQISYYFIELGGASARSIMTSTSFQVLQDHFPFGTGFGTYGSSAAAENYSAVYELYGFDEIYELASWNPNAFLSDTFWPIILGQGGFIGTIAFVVLLCLLFYHVFSLKRINRYCFLAGMFLLLYLLISSIAEPSFHNAIAIPLAVILGGLIRVAEHYRYPDGCPSTSIMF